MYLLLAASLKHSSVSLPPAVNVLVYVVTFAAVAAASVVNGIVVVSQLTTAESERYFTASTYSVPDAIESEACLNSALIAVDVNFWNLGAAPAAGDRKRQTGAAQCGAASSACGVNGGTAEESVRQREALC